ncbi:MAG: PrsW family intramembrane metalloprotease [Chloroflexi bacterium]|nr:PrsW family intramembrane metalloprotease [Chloroflexota bacterium]
MKNNKNELNQGSEIDGETSPQDQTPNVKEFDWLTVGQFAFSLIAGLILLGAFLISSLLLSVSAVNAGIAVPESEAISSYLFTAGIGFAGILMVPSLIYSGKKLFGLGTSPILHWKKFIWISYIFPIPILLGFTIQSGPPWSQYLLPVVHVLANGAGIFWILDLARRKMPVESAQRVWGSFASGLTLAPAISFVVEVALLIVIGVFWLFLLQTQPEFKQDLLNLANKLQQSSGDSALLQRSAGKFIARPGVAGTIFLYIAVLIPIVEEILKPIGVWLLLGRKLLPREGFIIGATAGAGYALFENLTIGAGADIWTFVMISRLGTAAVHVMTSGLMGWGLASAWTEKRYGRLAGSFLAAVSLHGVWNALNILTALAEFPAFYDRLGNFGSYFAGYAPAGLVILAVGCMIGLLRANSAFRHAIMAQEN